MSRVQRMDLREFQARQGTVRTFTNQPGNLGNTLRKSEQPGYDDVRQQEQLAAQASFDEWNRQQEEDIAAGNAWDGTCTFCGRKRIVRWAFPNDPEDPSVHCRVCSMEYCWRCQMKNHRTQDHSKWYSAQKRRRRS